VVIDSIKTIKTENSSPQEISLKELRQLNSKSTHAFQLTLIDNHDILVCHTILRILTGKRLVAFGRWGGKEVVAKIFYESYHAARHASRDYNGIKSLLDAAVLTPAIYYKGTAKNKHIHVLIFEKIKGTSLDHLWQTKKTIEELVTPLQAMSIELATQHVLGILQHDLHFKNFLLQKKNIYTIDGGAIEIFLKPLSKEKSMRNLALFFSQLGVGREKLFYLLYQTYAHARGWLVKEKDFIKIQKQIQHYQNSRWHQFRKKIMRTCSDFVCEKKFSQTKIYDRTHETPELLQYLNQPDDMFIHGEILKAGRTTTVAKIRIANKNYIIKRYNIKNSWHWLRRCLRPTRAVMGWIYGQRLRLLDIATSKPIAFIENRFLGLRGTSYLLMEYIDGIDAGSYFANPHNADNQPNVAKKILFLFKKLEMIRTTHGDLKKTNILILDQNPVLIDLDGMREHTSKLTLQKTIKHEMKRFMQNWRDMPTIHEMFKNSE